jgi:hypothetical protein
MFHGFKTEIQIRQQHEPSFSGVFQRELVNSCSSFPEQQAQLGTITSMLTSAFLIA